MQLKKQNWKKTRNTAKFTEPTLQGYRARNGGYKTHDEYSQQLHSRNINLQDSFNS